MASAIQSDNYAGDQRSRSAPRPRPTRQQTQRLTGGEFYERVLTRMRNDVLTDADFNMPPTAIVRWNQQMIREQVAMRRKQELMAEELRADLRRLASAESSTGLWNRILRMMTAIQAALTVGTFLFVGGVLLARYDVVDTGYALPFILAGFTLTVSAVMFLGAMRQVIRDAHHLR